MMMIDGGLRAFFKEGIVEAGIDEAGRGCLAGPVCAAAVILRADFHHPLLNDSKKLSEAVRDELRPIIEREAIAWAVAMVDHAVIDKINILQATYKAMHEAVENLCCAPELLLVDGNRFLPYLGIAHQCVIKGDATFASIAAASILAKTHRDAYMQELHTSHNVYGWNQNKGYGTKKHLAGIEAHGYSPYHRRSFKLRIHSQHIMENEEAG
jgi:ribonuclease HII